MCACSCERECERESECQGHISCKNKPITYDAMDVFTAQCQKSWLMNDRPSPSTPYTHTPYHHMHMHTHTHESMHTHTDIDTPLPIALLIYPLPPHSSSLLVQELFPTSYAHGCFLLGLLRECNQSSLLQHN